MPVPSYSVRIRELGLCPYELKSLRTDLLLLYRIINCAVVVPGVELSKSSIRPNRLVVSRPGCSLERFFFMHRTVMLWNRYLTDFDFSSPGAFKTSLMSLSFSNSLRGSAFKAT